MKNLANFLEKFSKLLNKGALIKEAVAEVIKKRTSVSLLPEQIYLKGEVLEIDSSPVAKNEIRLKEEAIKTELKELHKIFISRILYK